MSDGTLYGAVKALYRSRSRALATALALRTASCGVLMIDPAPTFAPGWKLRDPANP